MISWQTYFRDSPFSALYLIKTASKKFKMNGAEHTPYLHSLAVLRQELAQFGRALLLGSRGRRFKSYIPDWELSVGLLT